jgi:hypothetical protein
MSNYATIRKATAAVALSTAIGLTSLVGGAASADGPSLTGSSTVCAPKLFYALTHNESARPGCPAPLQASDDRPTEEVAFYYNRIAFNYAASK